LHEGHDSLACFPAFYKKERGNGNDDVERIGTEKRQAQAESQLRLGRFDVQLIRVFNAAEVATLEEPSACDGTGEKMRSLRDAFL
jgi:hypothetical protein